MRLAARLTGWRIDIRSEAQMAEQEAAAQAAAAASRGEQAPAVEAPVEQAPEIGETAAPGLAEEAEAAALAGEGVAGVGVPALKDSGTGGDSSSSAEAQQ